MNVAPALDELVAAWNRRDYSTAPMSAAVIRLLAGGAPVTAAALADATGLTVREAEAWVESAGRRGVEVEDGAVVGAALTLRPTRHRFRVRGVDLYTWCGFDALYLPLLLEEATEVASTCPATGQEIRLTVTAAGVATDVTPAGVVVAIVGQQVLSCCSGSGPESEICAQMPFLASRKVGDAWVVDHPGTAVLALSDARAVAASYVFGASGPERPC